MKILLTGSTGFIGRHLQPALVRAGHEVVPGSRSSSAAVRADFTTDHDPAIWVPRLRGIDAVINAVGIIRESGTQRFESIHTRAPQALFKACEEVGVGRVLQISALGADEHAVSRYHLSKRAADEALARTRLDWVVVQPSLVFGIDGTSARLFAFLGSLPLIPVPGRGEQLIQPIHIDDLCEGIVRLLGGPARRARLPLVGPVPLQLRDFLAQLRASMQLGKAPYVPVPMPLVRAGAIIGARLPGALLDPETLGMLVRGNTGDARQTAMLLGRAPRSTAEFIARDQVQPVRTRALLDWLLPLLRLSIAAVWIVTAIVSLGVYPRELSYDLLGRTGLHGATATGALFGAALLDLVLGVATLVLRRRRLLWLVQIVLICAYTIIITLRLPEFWAHPYGPVLKNLPLLAALWLLFELEERR